MFDIPKRVRGEGGYRFLKFCIVGGRNWLAILTVALLVTSSTRMRAQVLYGGMIGTVTDQTGAVIPEADVEIASIDTGAVRHALTDGSGNYDASNLPAGRFTVKITKAGFASFRAAQVQVGFNTQTRVDAKLTAGSEDQVVTVSAEAAQLQTDRADVHTDVNSKQLQDLPQATRTYQGLVGLAAGVNPPSPGFAGGGGTNNPGRSFIITANGTSSSGTDVRIDGVSAVNPWVQFYSTAVPSTEAIESVNIVTSSPEAEQGLASGAQVNVQLKSGTNQFHGSLYELHQDNALKAKPYFLSSATRIPKLIDNDFGGTLGGPFLRNKLFFFASYEGDFLIQGSSSIVSVPTGTSDSTGGLTGIRAGDFSGASTTIYDPSQTVRDANGNVIAKVPFAGNRIPRAQLNSVTQKLIALLPATNFGAAGAQANNYFVVTPNRYTLHKLDTKVTWDASPKLRFAGRYSQYPYSGSQVSVFGPLLGGANFNQQYGDTYATTVSATYIATPHLLFDGSWGFTRAIQNLVPPRTDERAGSEGLGLPGTNLGDLPAAGGLPQFNVSNYSGYGYSYPFLQYNDSIFQYAGNVTWTRGAHNIKFGVNVSQQRMNHLENNPTQFNFTGGSTAQVGSSSINNFNSYADFLLGKVNNRSNSQLVGPVTLRTWEYSGYIRDQWQVLRSLTLSIGTGYEYYPVPTRENRGIERFDFATNTYLICGAGDTPKNCGIDVSKLLFTPRMGVAYRPDQKTVFRAGYGLGREQLNMYRDGLYSYPSRLGYTDAATNPYFAVSNVQDGIPTLQPPAASVGSIPIAQLPNGVTFVTNDQKFVRGYVQSYNMTMERDFGGGFLGSIAYVGTRTIHQHTRYNANAGMVLGANQQGQYFYTLPIGGGKSLGITGAETAIRPLESMSYNSLQSSLDKRLSAGLQLHAAYTWSKWIAICCDTSGDGGPAISIPQYFRLNRAPAPGDLRNNFVLSAIYELPFGKNKMFLQHGIAATIAGGWQINGLLSLHSGNPFSASSDGSSLGAPGNQQRADLVKPIRLLGAHDGVNPYFDTTSFSPVPQGQIRFGTSSFNNIYGPGYKNLDFSVFRSFTFFEKVRLQARADALNLTNHPNFLNPGTNGFTQVGTAGFGVITATNPGSRTSAERYLRLGLKLEY